MCGIVKWFRPGRGIPGGSEDGRSSLEDDRPWPRGVPEAGLAPGFRVPGCLPYLAGPCVDNQGVHVPDGDAGGRDFQPGNRRASRLRRCVGAATPAPGGGAQG